MATKTIKKIKKSATTDNRYIFTNYELKNKNSKLIYIIWGIITYFGAILVTIPFIWMVIMAMLPSSRVFLPPDEIIKNFKFNFEYFKQAWDIAPFTRYFFNSLFVSFAVVIGQILISAAAAYSISKLKPTGFQIILFLFLATIMIPFETITIPLYLFMRDFEVIPGIKFNLLNTYWALIFPGIANAFNIFILKSFFDKLPDDFIEAARVDGYSETRIFFKIIIPISKPIIVVLSILNFVNIWNSFFWPLIVVNEQQIYTLMLGIYKIIAEGQPWNIVMASVTFSMVPTILLFILFQKYIMRGVVFTTLQE